MRFSSCGATGRGCQNSSPPQRPRTPNTLGEQIALAPGVREFVREIDSDLHHGLDPIYGSAVAQYFLFQVSTSISSDYGSDLAFRYSPDRDGDRFTTADTRSSLFKAPSVTGGVRSEEISLARAQHRRRNDGAAPALHSPALNNAERAPKLRKYYSGDIILLKSSRQVRPGRAGARAAAPSKSK
ncbi:hypothetical protein EVAR_24758_1 [Eumeta japonica]|uniref:Uncharacterized protein n=1 Tax=Eumeta variegata TaxID=151549 RepID=A0A4C1VGB9_EUMVA|nr:hypothetical protein EVAR_24758_1 [Eumeta japonica]